MKSDTTSALAAATNWRKSSRSHQNGCVEVGSAADHVGVRDSKLGGHSPVLPFSRRQWAQFTDGLRAGTYDR